MRRPSSTDRAKSVPTFKAEHKIRTREGVELIVKSILKPSDKRDSMDKKKSTLTLKLPPKAPTVNEAM